MGNICLLTFFLKKKREQKSYSLQMKGKIEKTLSSLRKHKSKKFNQQKKKFEINFTK